MASTTDAFQLEELTVTKSKIVRRASDLTPEESEQLTRLVSAKVAFGNPKDIQSVEDCFNRKNVDDGIIFYKELKADASDPEGMVFYYWLGYFGGNPIGYLLCDRNCALQSGYFEDDRFDSQSPWIVVIGNCDGDFIWRGRADKKPNSFIKAVKKAHYGDKYCEERDG